MLSIRTRISRQIGLLIFSVLLVVMAIFIGLIWKLASPQLNIYALYALVLYTVVAAILLVLGVYYLVGQFIRKPLNELTTGLKRAEQGDFLYRVQVRTKNEIGQLFPSSGRPCSRPTWITFQFIVDKGNLGLTI